MRKALLHAALDDVLEVNDAEPHPALSDDERRAAGARDALNGGCKLRRRGAPFDATYFSIASAAPLRISRPSRLTPDMRVWAVNGTNSARDPRWSPGCRQRPCRRRRVCTASSRPRSPYFSFGQHDDRAPLPGLVCSDASCAASASCASLTPGRGMNRTPACCRA
jgi:hypothetical protein